MYIRKYTRMCGEHTYINTHHIFVEFCYIFLNLSLSVFVFVIVGFFFFFVVVFLWRRRDMSTTEFNGDTTAPFFGFLGAAAALVFSCKHVSFPLVFLRICSRFPLLIWCKISLDLPLASPPISEYVNLFWFFSCFISAKRKT